MQRPSYVAHYLPGLIEEGHTGASALAFLRANGHQIGTQRFYRLWGETQDQLAKGEAFVSEPLNRTPSASQIGTATRPRARGYLYNIKMAIQDSDTGEISFRDWGVRTQKLISIGKALRLAVESWNDRMDAEGGRYTDILIAPALSNVLNLVGEDDALAVE